MDRTASARWTGDLKSGKGSIKLGSGAFDGAYSFGTRFENAPGINPEELLGAAHAGCFTMALSHALAQAGHPVTSVDTVCTVHANKVGDGFAITGIDIVTRGVVPGLLAADFQTHAEATKTGCIISRALAAVPMTLKATLA
ncbi:MAG TPA: OsmC family protein [Gemmatimonadales bacterium]